MKISGIRIAYTLAILAVAIAAAATYRLLRPTNFQERLRAATFITILRPSGLPYTENGEEFFSVHSNPRQFSEIEHLTKQHPNAQYSAGDPLCPSAVYDGPLGHVPGNAEWGGGEPVICEYNLRTHEFGEGHTWYYVPPDVVKLLDASFPKKRSTVVRAHANKIKPHVLMLGRLGDGQTEVIQH